MHTLPPWFRHPCPEDVHVSEDVFERNEYRLPERFAATDVILDLGGHAGSFALACLERGAGQVWSVEPWPANAALLRANTRWYRRQVQVIAAACWRSDHTGWRVFLDFPGTPQGEGGRSVVGTALGLLVETVALDHLIERAGDHIRLLKVDVEGAEYPILGTAQHLGKVAEIAGEWHVPAAGSVAESYLAKSGMEAGPEWLEEALAVAGFDFESVPDAVDRGHFFARRS